MTQANLKFFFSAGRPYPAVLLADEKAGTARRAFCRPHFLRFSVHEFDCIFRTGVYAPGAGVAFLCVIDNGSVYRVLVPFCPSRNTAHPHILYSTAEAGNL